MRTCNCACRVLSVNLTHRELALGRMLSQTAASAALANNKFVWKSTCHVLPPQPLFVLWDYTTLVGHLTAHPLHNPNSSWLAHQNCAHSAGRFSLFCCFSLWTYFSMLRYFLKERSTTSIGRECVELGLVWVELAQKFEWNGFGNRKFVGYLFGAQCVIPLKSVKMSPTQPSWFPGEVSNKLRALIFW